MTNEQVVQLNIGMGIFSIIRNGLKSPIWQSQLKEIKLSLSADYNQENMEGLLMRQGNPLLDHPYRRSARHARKTLPAPWRWNNHTPWSASLDGADDRSEQLQDAVSQLLSTFQGEKAAFNLRSKISSRDIAFELSRLFERVRNGDFNYTYYRPLMTLVIKKAPDHDIWSAVLDLITRLPRVTPTPASVPPAFNSTPITHTSASQQGAEQTRKLIEARVFEEIRDCAYRVVPGLAGSPKQEKVHDWLFQLQDNYLSKERRRYYTINIPRELIGGEARRQVDLIVKRKSGKPSDTEHDWRDIEAIGELKASDNRGVKDTLVQLARSGPFNIHKEPERFIRMMAGYTMMNEDELGLDMFIERDGNNRFQGNDAGTNPKKRSRSNSQRSGPFHNEVTYDVEETQGASLVAPSNGPYDNRILRCLVIYPAGRPIHKYRSSLELLQALRDAVKAHKSLYFKGNVLHRDISENNIIITNTEETGFAGMLIDMDLAKELGTGRSGARCRTGTMEFMAIDVLLGADHTYRHDLESLFYVLIWQCARLCWTKWYTGTFRDIARIKRSDMGVDGFEDILNEFPQPFGCVKPLCKELRGILFPYRNGLFTGTPKDPEILYRPIIYAFDKAIDDIKAME
ncbi:predicted protein [Histoplasma mississippiense (nom. inval.)]|uniref:predicted protein n=1 Tax=Ajellomyces capsulatus (strain NAm1 / WU24) TaxID=2059318 RepID=UPI000157B593|nr:predicted protein [Histoplasma mississippiense (nom. inval.)]EDN02619.1 predicted protein [Histoplasma mississippiense (nom. inval.)]